MTRLLDSIVVGGGPAGALTARILARRGWSVLLAEKGPRHRDKACGHCLNARAMRILDAEGLLDDVRRVASGRTDRLRVHRPGRMPVEFPMPGGKVGPGLVVERYRLDQLLVDAAAAAGVIVRQPATARIERIGSGRTTVRISEGNRSERLETSLVVGADGLRSAVGRAAGLAGRGRAGRKFGFAYDVVGCAAARSGVIEMFVVRGGYVGVVSSGGGRAHLAGLTSRAIPPREFVAAIAAEFDVLRGEGWSAPEDGPIRFTACGPMPCRPRRVANGVAALVGDAAGYVEPFTGEGMSWALESAQILGRVAVAGAPGEWTAPAAAQYARSWRIAIARRQRICRWVAKVIERPALTDVLLRTGSGWPRLSDSLVRRVVAT